MTVTQVYPDVQENVPSWYVPVALQNATRSTRMGLTWTYSGGQFASLSLPAELRTKHTSFEV